MLNFHQILIHSFSSYSVHLCPMIHWNLYHPPFLPMWLRGTVTSSIRSPGTKSEVPWIRKKSSRNRRLVGILGIPETPMFRFNLCLQKTPPKSKGKNPLFLVLEMLESFGCLDFSLKKSMFSTALPSVLEANTLFNPLTTSIHLRSKGRC